MHDRERDIAGDWHHKKATGEMNPALGLAGIGAAAVLAIGVLAASGEIEMPKSEGERLREVGRELYRAHLDQNKLIDAVVNEADDDPVAFRSLPLITSDLSETNIITRIPEGTALRGVMVEDEVTGQVWLETEFEGKMGFIKASELDILGERADFDIYSIQTGREAPLSPD